MPSHTAYHEGINYMKTCYTYMYVIIFYSLTQNYMYCNLS